MNIVFFGSSHFGLPSLKALVSAGYKISCVVTPPDRKKGRGLVLSKTLIKAFAENNNIEVYQPEKINTLESAAFLKKIQPDLFIVIAYGQILSQGLLDIPAIMPLNVHGSILPFYRGAAPINWALINGETETGITLIKMTEKMDAGPVIAKQTAAIEASDDFISLEDKLSRVAAPLLIETVNSIANSNYRLIPQDEKIATLAPKLKKEDGLIDWNKPVVEIYNLVRGLSGWPGAFTYYHAKRLKILQAGIVRTPEQHSARAPGEIIAVSREGIIVAAKGASLVVKQLQMEGKNKMASGEFIAGHKISPGDRLGYPAPRN